MSILDMGPLKYYVWLRNNCGYSPRNAYISVLMNFCTPGEFSTRVERWARRLRRDEGVS